MKKTATIAALTLGIAVLADIEGDYNTWLGYLAGEDASGNRTTVQGAGAGGGAEDLYRTDLIGAASGVYGTRFYDTVGIGYRALRYSCDVSNTVAIGSHAFEGVSMGGIRDATWINGHFVANPPKYNGSWWQQTPGEFYITGDASKTNSLAPIWYDGTNLHLRGYSPAESGTGGGGGSSGIVTREELLALMASAGMDYVDSTGAVWTAEYRVKLWNQFSALDATQEDEIIYLDETTFGGLRAWTNATYQVTIMYTGGAVYYATGSVDAANPLDHASTVVSDLASLSGVTFSMWTPNYTSFELVGYRPRDAVILRSGLRQALVDLGVRFQPED